MCERYSWLDIHGKIVFLTGRDIFHLSTGRRVQRHGLSVTRRAARLS